MPEPYEHLQVSAARKVPGGRYLMWPQCDLQAIAAYVAITEKAYDLQVLQHEKVVAGTVVQMQQCA